MKATLTGRVLYAEGRTTDGGKTYADLYVKQEGESGITRLWFEVSSKLDLAQFQSGAVVTLDVTIFDNVRPAQTIVSPRVDQVASVAAGSKQLASA
jgi:hypothetical protein